MKVQQWASIRSIFSRSIATGSKPLKRFRFKKIIFEVKIFERKFEKKIKARIVIGPGGIEFWRESLENLSPHKKVSLTRSASGFGISIKGGTEHNRPIIISKCHARNVGLKVELYLHYTNLTGNFKIGDRIISCAGHSLLNASHREAVDAIKVFFSLLFFITPKQYLWNLINTVKYYLYLF